jgi:hypothetical protein
VTRSTHPDIDRALADQLLAERGLPEVAHLVLLAVAVVLLHGAVPRHLMLPWTVAVVLIIALRVVLWARARRARSSPHEVALTVRLTMSALGLAWGLGTAVATFYVSAPTLANLELGLAGLLAGGLATLVADQWTFRYYALALFVPVLISFLWAPGGLDLAAVVLVIIYVGFTLRLHTRAHGALVTRLQAEHELRDRESQIKTLRGYLRVCAQCRRVLTQDGTWEQLESYVRRHTDAEFSHGICPDCATDWARSAERIAPQRE